jgi:hypothetical protein
MFRPASGRSATARSSLTSTKRRLFISGGGPFLEKNSGRHSAALRATKFVERKIAAIGVPFDPNQLYWFAAVLAGIIHEQVDRHVAFLCGLSGGARTIRAVGRIVSRRTTIINQ